jgi:hypothetical protein
MSTVYFLLLVSQLCICCVIYGLITGQVLALVDLPLCIGAWIVQVDVPSRAVWGVNNMLFVGCYDILRLQTEVIRNNNMSMVVQFHYNFFPAKSFRYPVLHGACNFGTALS